MTMVSAVTALSTTQATKVNTSASAGFDYNAFLRMLMEQIRHQDPTKPMDSTEFVNQIATLSQVEQSVQTNAKLEAMLNASALQLATTLIGRTITSSDGETTGVVESVLLTSDGPVARLEDGELVWLGPGVIISNTDDDEAADA